MSATQQLDWAALERFRDARRERFARGIYPTEADRAFFDRNDTARHRGASHRSFHVRPTVKSDHWVFEVGGMAPDGFITIVGRGCQTVVVAEDAERFGPWVNSDEYAALRWDALKADDKRRMERLDA